jgi:hypothetical protein
MSDINYVAFRVHPATISAAVLNLEGKLLTQAVMQTAATAIPDFLRGLSRARLCGPTQRVRLLK